MTTHPSQLSAVKDWKGLKEHGVQINTDDVLHPDHAPPPGKTDTHFTVRRQYIEACSCCGGGCRWGMVVEPSQKNWHSISPIELRAQTYIIA